MLQALGKQGAVGDTKCPGYITLPVGAGEVIFVPFHLFPATPDLPILEEVLKLAAHVRVGEVGGRKAAVCLSGSTIMLRDVLSVGDIDFCEYVPATIPATELAETLRRQIVSQDARYCTVSIRLKAPNGKSDELRFVEVKHGSTFTQEQLNVLCQFIALAYNGKTAHVMHTSFAGVTEVTNWLIIFRDPLESDPASRLSFVHQEASLGIFGRRPLHTLESLAAYLNFLRIEIAKYALSNPVKALKRAIPWLRLFQADDLRVELLQMAYRHEALQAASVLSKIDLLKKYDGFKNLKPEFQSLLVSLKGEVESAGRQIVAGTQGLEAGLQNRILAFGQAASSNGEASLWHRILSLANQAKES